MADTIGEPRITAADAAETCSRPWPNRQTAWEEAKILRREGWDVLESTRTEPRTDGLIIIATVYHPRTHTSPGDLLCHPEGPPVVDRTDGSERDTE
jgi:hypothetical protein